MAEPTEVLTPEEEAALRELEAKHRRRHRWVALCWSVCVSVDATVILHTIWNGWPLHARDLGRLAFLIVTALGGLGRLEWGLRGLREHEATDRQWTMQHVRWEARDRAWRGRWAEPGGLRREGEAR
jgi:hypothetical protein